MLDHGTGIVIGETATVGCNCSILHHVTLGTSLKLLHGVVHASLCLTWRCFLLVPGGSGKKGVARHPQVGNGVLLGAGATVLGPVCIGEGSQVGAGTLVITDLPAHSVAVGVPARIIGSFVDVTEQPSIEMNQIVDERSSRIQMFQMDGI
jgi:serine O-acetyltransferase